MPTTAKKKRSKPTTAPKLDPRKRLVTAILRWLGPTAAEKVNLGENEQLHAVHLLLSEHLGSSGAALHFMRSMAGCTIRIPEIAMCERLARELVVLERSSQPDFSKEDRRRLSAHLGMHRKTIQSIARKGMARVSPPESEACLPAGL